MTADASSLSLEDAVKQKYCAELEEDGEALPAGKAMFKESAVAFRRDVYPVQHRTALVLDHSGITHVEGGGKLQELCPKAEELHLAANTISQWSDVDILLSTFPKLSFLDLTQNPLDSTTFTLSPLSPPPSLSPSHTLHTLVLNSTNIVWSALQVCLEMLHRSERTLRLELKDFLSSNPISVGFPQQAVYSRTLGFGQQFESIIAVCSPKLQELHLSRNGYSCVELDPDFKHPGLQKLHFNDNSLSKWEEIQKLSCAFPNLQVLVATSNPLAEISPVDPSAAFPELKSLNLNSSSIEQWKSVEYLATLAKLTDLSLLKTPLGAEMDEKQRRYGIIARLPNLKRLNKSEITETEREDAERWLVRACKHDPSPPAVYSSLCQKHGELNPLADVNLSTRRKASIEFCFDDSRSEIHCIKLRQTTLQLKRWVSKHIGAHPSTFRLLYVDVGSPYGHGGEEIIELRLDSRYLDFYPMKNGDRIEVQKKLSKRTHKQSSAA